MTALDRETFDLERPPSRIATLFRQWPIWTCIGISLLFMMATNDPKATTSWQEATRDEVMKRVAALESGRASRQIGLMLLGVYGFFAFLWPARRFRISVSALFPILVFIGWCFFSTVWSVEPGFTVKRLLVLGFLCLAVLGFVRQHRLQDLALLALVGGTMQLCASVIAELMWAKFGGDAVYRFSGLQHPNHSGTTAAVLMFGAFYFYDRTKLRRFLVVLAFAGIILLLTKSRSSLFACAAGMTMFCALRWPRKKTFTAIGLAAVGISVFLVASAAGLVPEDWSNVVNMGRADAEKTALTGRPQIWAAAMEMFGDEPVRFLTGVGYQTFWRPETADYVTNRLWFHISEGHNAFFDLMLEVGLVGSICYGFILLSTFLRWLVASLQHQRAAYALGAGMMTFVLVHSLTESMTIDPNFVTFLSYATMAFAALRSPKWLPRDSIEGPAFEEIACAS